MGRGIEALQLYVHWVCGFYSMGHCDRRCPIEFGGVGDVAARQAFGRGHRVGVHRDGVGETACLSSTGGSCNGLPACSAWTARAVVVGSRRMNALACDL